MILSAALLCLALNIYHEARGEPSVGQLAVAMVTLNRAEWKMDRVCNEVFEPYQFSWTSDPTLFGIKEPDAFVEATVIASQAIAMKDFTGGATHYYNPRHADPNWANSMIYLGKYGQHLFFKEQ